MESTWPIPMITVSSNNQTIGVILDFMRHLFIGFVCGQTDMYTVYIKAGQKASRLPVPRHIFSDSSPPEGPWFLIGDIGVREDRAEAL